MKPLRECRLYAFVDTAYLQGRPPAEVARQLCDGGADLIQLRAKDWSLDDIRRAAAQLLPIAEKAGVGLVINDHVEIAREIGAPLLHLGQEDFFDAGFGDASEVTSSSAMGGSHGAKPLLLGLSTHSPQQAHQALHAKPDYIAIGPVFATPTKPGRPPVTLDYVRWAADNVTLPWFAIGGITLQNLDEVLEAGATRVCVVRDILNAPDVARACRAFKDRLPSAASE